MSTFTKKVPEGRTVNWEASATGYIEQDGSFVMPDSPYNLNISLNAAGLVIWGYSDEAVTLQIDGYYEGSSFRPGSLVNSNYKPSKRKFIWNEPDKSLHTHLAKLITESNETARSITAIYFEGIDQVVDMRRALWFARSSMPLLTEVHMENTVISSDIGLDDFLESTFREEGVGINPITFYFDGSEINRQYVRHYPSSASYPNDSQNSPFFGYKAYPVDVDIQGQTFRDPSTLTVYARGCSNQSIENLKSWFWQSYNWIDHTIGLIGDEVDIWISDTQYWKGVADRVKLFPMSPHDNIEVFRYDWTLETV